MSEKLTTDAVGSVTEKLQSFAEGLSDDEKTVLDAILSRATEEDETSGFSHGNISSFRSFSIGRPTFKPQVTRNLLCNALMACGDDDVGWELILNPDKIGRL